MWRRAVLLLLPLCFACDNGPLMTPGQDCLDCHGQGRGRSFGVAGTIFPRSDSSTTAGLEGATIDLTAADGHKISLVSNAAGNFYTEEALPFPVFVDVQIQGVTRHMEPSLTFGDCNRCHGEPGREGAEGRVFVAPLTP